MVVEKRITNYSKPFVPLKKAYSPDLMVQMRKIKISSSGFLAGVNTPTAQARMSALGFRIGLILLEAEAFFTPAKSQPLPSSSLVLTLDS